MFSLKVAAPIAFASAIGLASIPLLHASGPNAAAVAADRAPVADAAGGSAGPPVYPSILNVRLVRGEDALKRLTAAVDDANVASAQLELNNVTSNITKAWNKAVYIIKTAPPPVAANSAITYTPGGPPTASPEEGGGAVLNLQHDFITNAIAMLDGPTALRNTFRSAIDTMVRTRAREINYIKSIAPPPAAVSSAAHAAGQPVTSGWDAVMPDVATMLGDEIQQILGTGPPDGATATSFSTWRMIDVSAQNVVNATWPPVPAG